MRYNMPTRRAKAATPHCVVLTFWNLGIDAGYRCERLPDRYPTQAAAWTAGRKWVESYRLAVPDADLKLRSFNPVPCD